MPIQPKARSGGLSDPAVSRVLERLHAEARRDWRVFLRALPDAVAGALAGRSVVMSARHHLSRAYIPVSAEIGRLLYQLAIAANAQRIVEFGSSFGLSSIYLAAAARETGGAFIGSEMDEDKNRTANENLSLAGLSRWGAVREGNAFESLACPGGPVDLLFLDGWKEQYVPMLELLEPHLSPGALVIADNIKTFPKTLAPFVERVTSSSNGYETSILPMGSGITLSVWRSVPSPSPALETGQSQESRAVAAR